MNAAIEKLIVATLDLDPSVTIEQRRVVMEILREGIRPRPRPAPMSQAVQPAKPAGKPFLRRKEAADYLRCSVRRVDQLKHDGDLSFHRLGRRLIVFKIDDLNALMLRNRVAVDDDDPSSR